MEAYFEALDGVPAWAVAEVRLAVIRGGTECDPRFAPTPPQLAELARKRLTGISDELRDLRRIEQAKTAGYEPAPDEQARVGKGFDRLLGELGVKSDEGRREEAIEWLKAQCRELGVPSSSVDELPDAPERTGTFRRPRMATA